MAQHKPKAAQQSLPIRELSVPEVIAQALYLRRKRGKTSRRVTIFLPPSLLPPKDGTYDTFLGEVQIRSVFSAAQGRWICVVKLPPEGFTIADHVSSNTPPSQQPSQPKSSRQPDDYVDITLSPRELEEVKKFLSQLQQ